MNKSTKHIVVDARIRRASTGRPVDRFLHYLPELDQNNRYTVLIEPSDDIRFKASNIEVKICGYKRFSMNPLQQFGFSWMLYRLRPDLVYFTMSGLTPLLYFGKNTTFTHDLTMLRFVRAGKQPEWLHQIRMLGYRLLFWKANKFASKIIVPTNFIKKDLATYSPSLENKIEVIYEAGDLPRAIKASPPKFKVQSSKFKFILHVGSPFPHKNISNLVLAFENLKESKPDLKLVLAGKKEYYFEQLEQWLKGRKYSEDVIVTGFVSDGELRWLYENAECYVLPSLSEGFGLPGLEAMAHGCPLVSSNATCLPEVYGDAAEYFDPSDVSSMTKAIDKVIGSEKIRAELIKNGQKQLGKYSWEKMSREILNIIKEV
jgi:glycosyltransferase involved in cell wall biosynthesis